VTAFLGEFGIQASDVGHGDPWPELDGADETDTRTRVVERLKLTREKEYPLVLIWADGLDGRGKPSSVPGPDPRKLSPEAQLGIKDFMKLP
jgi:hypothetical protein